MGRSDKFGRFEEQQPKDGSLCSGCGNEREEVGEKGQGLCLECLKKRWEAKKEEMVEILDRREYFGEWT